MLVNAQPPGITPRFLKTITKTYGEIGHAWLQQLPEKLINACQALDLQICGPLPLSYNYVVLVSQANGNKAVLKLGAPDPEFQHEIAALKAYNGRGCARILQVSLDRSYILLEHCHPGMPLASLRNDRQRTFITAGLYGSMRQPAPQGANLIQLRQWFTNIKKKQALFNGITPACLLQNVNDQANDILEGLFAASTPSSLLHGDLHHFNILSKEDSWVAIDPKGVVGPAEYECGPLLLNPWPRLMRGKDPAKTSLDRIAILSEVLGYDRQVIRGWGICHSVLSAWWDVDPITGKGGEYSGSVAKMLSHLKV